MITEPFLSLNWVVSVEESVNHPVWLGVFRCGPGGCGRDLNRDGGTRVG